MLVSYSFRANDQFLDGEQEYVAIKKIRLRNSLEGLSQDAIREIKLLQELDHPSVMKVANICEQSFCLTPLAL